MIPNKRGIGKFQALCFLSFLLVHMQNTQNYYDGHVLGSFCCEIRCRFEYCKSQKLNTILIWMDTLCLRIRCVLIAGSWDHTHVQTVVIIIDVLRSCFLFAVQVEHKNVS